MLALIIILVPTANAQSYVADDSVVISSQYHDLFNNYFDGKLSYQYFPYECDSLYSRTCYYGIDSEGNYLNVYYIRSDNSYEQRIEVGKDENFSVTGSNVIKKDVNTEQVELMAMTFFILTVVLLWMW